MPKKSPSRFARDYILLCHYKWQFLRRNPSYILDYQAFTRSHGKPASGPILGFHGPDDPSSTPEASLCRKYGIGYLHDPADEGGVAKSPCSSLLAEAAFGKGRAFINPFFDNLAGERVFPAANTGRQVVYKDGYEHFYDSLVFDMRASVPFLMAQAELLLSRMIEQRAKAGLPVPKAKRAHNPRPRVMLSEDWEWSGETHPTPFDPIEEEPYYILVTIDFGDDGAFAEIKEQLQALLSSEADQRREAAAPVSSARFRLRFEEFDQYLQVWDLRASGLPWKQVAQRLYPKEWKEGFIKLSNRASRTSGPGAPVDPQDRHPAVKLVMEQYKRAEELIMGGYRDLDYCVPTRTAKQWLMEQSRRLFP